MTPIPEPPPPPPPPPPSPHHPPPIRPQAVYPVYVPWIVNDETDYLISSWDIRTNQSNFI
jgi:hypothetical protein